MEPTGDTPKLPKLPDLRYPKILEEIKPKVLGKRMTNDAIVTMFVSHVHYMYDGRPLAREETFSLMRRYWYNDSRYKMIHAQFDKFEDLDTALRTALQRFGDDKIEAVKAYVDHLFRNLLEGDPEVQARARILSGLPGRLPIIDLGFKEDAIVFRYKQLEPYQYLFHYTAVNWGKERLNKEQIEGLLVFHYKFDSKITKVAIDHCSKVLANPEHSTTMKVAPIAEEYRDFFEQKVFEEFEEYEKSKSQGSSSKSTLGLDPLSNVTEALGNSTLQAFVEPPLSIPEDQAQGPKMQEKGKGIERRRKRPKSPDSGQQHRPHPPPPPPPPAAAPSRPRGSLPYDPTRVE